jgi:hypothetical protein
MHQEEEIKNTGKKLSIHDSPLTPSIETESETDADKCSEEDFLSSDSEFEENNFLLLERSAVFRNKCKAGECQHNLTSPIKLKFKTNETEFKLENMTFENIEKVSSERKDDSSEANCDTPLDILELENMMSENVVKVDSERKNACSEISELGSCDTKETVQIDSDGEYEAVIISDFNTDRDFLRGHTAHGTHFYVELEACSEFVHLLY